MTESAFINEFIHEAGEHNTLGINRQHLIKILDLKFQGSVTSQVVEAINNQSVVEILEDWWTKATTTKT